MANRKFQFTATTNCTEHLTTRLFCLGCKKTVKVLNLPEMCDRQVECLKAEQLKYGILRNIAMNFFKSELNFSPD